MAGVPPTTAVSTTAPITLIRPSRRWVSLDLGELFRYRELIYFLTWRDIKVRYKQTLFGAGWAILQPFLTMVVFSLFFGELVGVPSAPVLAGLLDFALAGIVLVGMMAYYAYAPTAAIWSLPLFLLLAVITTLGVSFLLSAMNVAYRDVGYLIPFLMRLWFFLTPIVYPASQLPEAYRWIYALNPMVGVVEGFRFSLLGSALPSPTTLLASTTVALALLIRSTLYFRHMERTFADVV